MTPQGRPGTCLSGMCECTPQCNKECGDNGCGGQCPACGNGRRCVSDRCVECQTDSECSELNSENGCTVGRCSNGTCMPSNTRASCTTERNAPGQCTLGQCVCTPGQGCSGKCGNAVDTCNIPCGDRCSSNQECDGDRCVESGKELYEACTMDSSGGRGNCSSGMTCATFNTTTSVCWHSLPCPAGHSEAFSLCAVNCADNPARCPSRTSCEGTWCVPTAYLLP